MTSFVFAQQLFIAFIFGVAGMLITTAAIFFATRKSGESRAFVRAAKIGAVVGVLCFVAAGAWIFPQGHARW